MEHVVLCDTMYVTGFFFTEYWW